MSYFNPKYVKELTDKDFQLAKLDTGDNYAVVFFYATYCGYCSKSKDDYEEFSRTCPFINVYCINGPEYVQVKECINTEHGNMIMGWPTIIFFKDGKPVYVVQPNSEARKAKNLMKVAMSVTTDSVPN